MVVIQTMISPHFLQVILGISRYHDPHKKALFPQMKYNVPRISIELQL